MKSLLPSHDDVNKTQMMRIYRTQLNQFKYNNVKTHLELVDNQSGKRQVVSSNIYRIDDPNITGYMPSKMWHDDDGFNMLFYTNPTMPDAARPFGDNPCYAFALYVRNGTSVEYDWQTRIFIDQIQTRVGTAYMFLFSEANAKTIMQTQWNGQPWEIERPHLSADVVSLYDGDTAKSITEAGIDLIKHIQESMPPDEFLDNLFKMK